MKQLDYSQISTIAGGNQLPQTTNSTQANPNQSIIKQALTGALILAGAFTVGYTVYRRLHTPKSQEVREEPSFYLDAYNKQANDRIIAQLGVSFIIGTDMVINNDYLW